MSDYLPEAFPGDIYTFLAGEAITGGQLVKVSTAADATVLKSTEITDFATAGVAARDAASAANVPVYCRGVIHRLTAAGAITRGDLVGPGTVDGSVSTVAAVIDADVDGTPSSAHVNLNARGIIGVALESIADTAVGRVMFF